MNMASYAYGVTSLQEEAYHTQGLPTMYKESGVSSIQKETYYTTEQELRFTR